MSSGGILWTDYRSLSSTIYSDDVSSFFLFFFLSFYFLLCFGSLFIRIDPFYPQQQFETKTGRRFRDEDLRGASRKLWSSRPKPLGDQVCMRAERKVFWGVEGGGRCLLGAARPLAEREWRGCGIIQAHLGDLDRHLLEKNTKQTNAYLLTYRGCKWTVF